MGSQSSEFDDNPVVSEQQGVRYLHFDSPWIQGAMDIKHPDRLVLSYTAQMMGWLLFLQPDDDQPVGQLGLGAASITRFCYKHLPNPLMVVERNRSVIRVCEQYFRMPRHNRLTVFEGDAGNWVGNPDNWQTLSVLMVDLYDTEALGPVCDSLEFYRGCFDCLVEPGILSVNLFGKHESFDHNLENLRAVFGNRLIRLPPVDEGNQIVLAFKGPDLSVSRSDLMQRADFLEQAYGLPAKRWARSIGAVQSL
ncbi:spermidine synthase [Orrella daihaiensis]|uniref:Spermidine synthase n=1 Tax=Orrella daihaiensis TaxID=2782176 RepID=A0ABY4ALP8_9BURK|nr:spermidine synthase [Orrella daihaiensis]UOD51197.1 spermidine synthase [Orrella daihaiensis]